MAPDAVKRAAARLAELRDLVELYNHQYHVLDAPEVTDAQYDRLFDELLAIEALSLIHI